MTTTRRQPDVAKRARVGRATGAATALVQPNWAAAEPASFEMQLARPKPAWDVSDIDDWGPDEHQLGATIPEAGNSIYRTTGGWRSQVPQIDSERCDGCLLCSFFCPDASIIVDRGKVAGVDLAHCKGCGICAAECSPGAIVMRPVAPAVAPAP